MAEPLLGFLEELEDDDDFDEYHNEYESCDDFQEIEEWD